MAAFIVIAIALLLDRWLGEANRFHPLVGFGRITSYVETCLNPNHPKYEISAASSPWLTRGAGILALIILLLTPCAAIYFLLQYGAISIEGVAAIEVIGLYFCIGRQSLMEHANAIAIPLMQGDMNQARYHVGMIVSRQTQTMNEEDITKATVESVLENSNDACFATLFWFLIGGLPLAIVHRLSNTLDAMWGYKTDRHLHFGWAAAKLDDLLGWVPARLGALALLAIGQSRKAWACWQQQAHQYDSPNGGVIMAAGAGALGIQLGGKAIYHGKEKLRPILGEGRPPCAIDIQRSMQLVNQATVLWLLVIFAIGIIL